MRIVYKKSTNYTFAYVQESFRKYVNGKSVNTSHNVYKFGRLDLLKEAHPNDLDEYMNGILKECEEKAKLEKEKVKFELDPNKDIPLDDEAAFNVGCIYIKELFTKLKLDEHLDSYKENDKAKYHYSVSEIALHLICASIICPGSKIHSYRIKENLLLPHSFKKDDIYRCLDVLAKHCDEINSYTYKKLKKYVNIDSHIYYYDCTNFYFTSEVDDDFRRSKKSKEGIYAPLVQMGILIDEYGFIIGMIAFPGNKNEQPSLKQIEEKLVKHIDLKKVVICTDAGLGSNDNRYFNTLEERSFICTHSLKGSKDYIKEFALKDENWKTIDDKDMKIADLIASYYSEKDEKKKETICNTVLYKSRLINDDISINKEYEDENGEIIAKKETIKEFEQKLIMTFSLKYYFYQLKKLEKEIAKAKAVIDNRKEYKDYPDKSFKRFINNIKLTKNGEIAEECKLELDTALIDEEKKWFGYYCIATNLLEDNIHELIETNHDRWQIEYAFRTMKTCFDCRPIYLWTKDHIIGHLILVCLALNLLKILKYKLTKSYEKHNASCLKDEDKYSLDDLTLENIIITLRRLNVTKLYINQDAYVPSFKRTILTDMIAKEYEISFSKQVIKGDRIKKLISM